MKDIVPQLRAWQQQGKRFALATLVKVDRTSPKPPGAAMAVCEDGNVAGSVSGGCVESDLHMQADAVLANGVPKTVTYGISDEQGFEIGLACGGQLHLFVDCPSLPSRLFQEIESNHPLAMATVVSGDHAGGRLILWPEGAQQAEDFGDDALRESVLAEARTLLTTGANALKNFPQGDVFIQTFAPPAEMYIFGAADFSAALAKMGRFLGFHVTVIDPRTIFATKERFPDANEIVIAWPDAFLKEAPVSPSTAICVLAHDAKFDIPALQRAMATDAGYIGAMGAKRTNEERLRKLRELGCTEDQLARIHAPIGLDIGGKSPEETAVSIAAQIVAWRSGKL
ncbi:MAG TPA: XdhC/CoxI family protein [Chloroflexota bacterium]|nr:XdhC/CoxI family protein [Chloroflexota bacterium]